MANKVSKLPQIQKKDSKKAKTIPYSRDNPPKYDRIGRLAEYLTFVEWHATFSGDRTPKDQKDLAKNLKMAKTTLTNWKLMPEFRRDVFRKVQDKIALKFGPDVFHSWSDRLLTASSAGDIKLFAQIFHDFKEEMTLDTPGVEKLAAIMRRLVEKGEAEEVDSEEEDDEEDG